MASKRGRRPACVGKVSRAPGGHTLGATPPAATTARGHFVGRANTTPEDSGSQDPRDQNEFALVTFALLGGTEPEEEPECGSLGGGLR